MTEQQKLIILNLVNGVPAEQVAATFHVEPADIDELFQATMRAVAEYRLVHCVPHFECGDVHNARRNRLKVLAVLGAIERWDTYEREVMLSLFKGQGVAHFGHDRAEVEAMLQRTRDALPNYLEKPQLAQYLRDRDGFFRTQRRLIIETLEKFVSLTEPLKYKRITHEGFDGDNVGEIVSQMAGTLSTRERTLQ